MFNIKESDTAKAPLVLLFFVFSLLAASARNPLEEPLPPQAQDKEFNRPTSCQHLVEDPTIHFVHRSLLQATSRRSLYDGFALENDVSASPNASSPSSDTQGYPARSLAARSSGTQNEHVFASSSARTLLSPEAVSVGVCVTLFFISLCCLAWAGPSGQFHWDGTVEEKEVELRSNAPLDADTFGLAVSILVRDTAVIARHEGKSYLRQIRFLLVFLLVFLNMSLQAFLLFQVLHLVTPGVINNLRDYYDKFEWHMYGKNESHFVLAADGMRRGLPGFFDPELFKTLEVRTKEEVCHIPFSQPSFWLVVLFIWTLTCMGELRKTWHLFRSLILTTPTVEHLEEMLKPAAADDPDKVNTKVIAGLTSHLKVFITAIVLIPRASITFVLLWLGSRWLAGTNNFGDLILNTVALEFILLLQSLLYLAVVPGRDKRDCRNIEVLPPHRHEKPGLLVFAGSFFWLVAGTVWVLLYTFYFQSVLPGYNWDVRDVCAEWLKLAHTHRQ